MPIPTLPSFLINIRDVEALLITLKAAVVEVEPLPAIVVLANNPVLVPIPTFPEESQTPKPGNQAAELTVK